MLTVTRSLFSAESVTELIKMNYALSAPIKCQLLCVGDNDHYLVTTDSGRYVLRIYKQDPSAVKTETNYLFELDWLKYLQEKRCLVAAPIPRKDGSFLGMIEVPEGLRRYVLFEYAEGDSDFLNRKRAFLLGREIARIHLISNKFKTNHTKPPLDLHFLLEAPIQSIKQHLGDTYVDEQERLNELAIFLKEKILSLLSFKEKDWGLIGGDFHGFNQKFMNNRLTLIDFDLCGYGWRAYDLATFRWLQLSDLEVGTHIIQTWINGRFLVWRNFLSGYQSIRRLSLEEQEAIPLFVQIRQIWWMGTYIQSQNPLKALDEDFWQKNFRRLFKRFQ